MSSPKPARLTGAERRKLASELASAYANGKTIRQLAQAHSRSYGLVHQLLTEHGVQIRPRGGTRLPARQPAAQPERRKRG